MKIGYLLIAIAFTANLPGGPQVPKSQQTSPTTAGKNSGNNKRPVPPTHVIIDPPFPAFNSQPITASGQNEPPEKPLPRFERPEWVIVYITAIYAIIAGLTLRAIKEQAEDARVVNANNADTASRTLRAIEQQAVAMEGQTGILERSVGAAETNAEAAVLAANTAKRALEISERADVLVAKTYIRYDNPVFAQRGEVTTLTPQSVIVFELKNFGRTRAEEFTSMATLYIFPPHRILQRSPGIPMVLGASDTFRITLLPFGSVRDFSSAGESVPLEQSIIDDINKGQVVVRWEIGATYKDVFGNQHSLQTHGTFLPGRGFLISTNAAD